MHNLLSETRMLLTALAKRENVNVCTVWRWAGNGVGGVRLETFSVGGRRYTTDEAFVRWVSEVSAAKSGQPLPSRPNRQRAADQRSAKRELQEAGF